jgi:phosphoglycolate phosphatase
LQAVIFDLDGTLIDSLKDLADSMNEVLEKAELPVHPTSAYRRFVGDGIRNLVRRALPSNHRSDDCVGHFTDRMREVYALRWDRETAPYPGIPEMLSELQKRAVPLAVLSNKPHPMTAKVVRALLPSWKFEVVLGAEAGFARKPDPAGALETARRLNIAPDRIVYVGDSDTDMSTATAAGMRAVGALWGFRDAAELTAAGADIVIRHPCEIAGLLEPA